MSNEILLVEDDPNDAELTLRALQKHNLYNKVVHVKDGANALDFFFKKIPGEPARDYPKAILLDLKLPKIDGLDVLRALKADDRTKAIPVVILTSSREEPDILESYKLGVTNYLVKPVEFDAFVKALSKTGLYWMLLNESPA